MVVSIIIVNWNTGNLLTNCLKSVSEAVQDLDFEVIVVDNASTDGSAAIVREYFPWVDLIESQINLGFAAGNNLALCRASGESFLLLNPDTIVLPEAISHLVTAMRANPRLGVAGAQLLNLDGSRQTSWGVFPSLWTEVPLLSRLGKRRRLQSAVEQSSKSLALTLVDWVSGAGLMIRRQAVEEVGLLDEAYWLYTEETDWCYRVCEAGWQIALSPAAQIYHLARAASRQRFVTTMLHFYQSRVRFMRKHHGDTQADLVRRLYWLRALLWQCRPEGSPLARAYLDLSSTEICAAYRQLQQAMSQPLDSLLASSWL